MKQEGRQNMDNARELKKQQRKSSSDSLKGVLTATKCPSAPPDDVVFHVGQETVLTISARKENLSKKNEVFHAMFFGPYEEARNNLRHRNIQKNSNNQQEQQQSPCSQNESVPIDKIYDNDVDGRAFKNLIDFLNGETVELRTVVTAVETLHAAQKYLCDGLMEKCVQYLSDQLSTDNVLQIFGRCRQYAPFPVSCKQLDYRAQSQEAPPSAPSLDQIERPARKCNLNYSNSDRTCWFTLLMNHCLEFIDKNASDVLNSEDFEELDAEMVELVLSRDDLRVHNETEILMALLRWSVFECHRRQVEVNVSNQRLVLGRLIWQVRFLAMPIDEVFRVPILSQLLIPQESEALLAFHRGQIEQDQLPPVIRTFLPQMATKRKGLLLAAATRERQLKSSGSCAESLGRKNGDSLGSKSGVTEKIFVCLACIFE